MLIAPPGFRTSLPARVDESGRIFRDISGLEELYDTKGSGAAPEMLRGEMGTIWVHDLERTLATQECELDAVKVTVAPAGAATTAAATFSFPTMPSGRTAARHRIISATCVMASAANLAGVVLRTQPFGDPTTVVIGFNDGANVITVAGHAVLLELLGPIENGRFWGRRDQDYSFTVRSNAGGATSVDLDMLVAMVPAGVEVPL